MNVVYNMSREWKSMMSNSYFKASTIYSYTEWKNLQDKRFDTMDVSEMLDINASNEWNSMLSSNKPPKTVQYVKKELLYF